MKFDPSVTKRHRDYGTNSGESSFKQFARDKEIEDGTRFANERREEREERRKEMLKQAEQDRRRQQKHVYKAGGYRTHQRIED